MEGIIIIIAVGIIFIIIARKIPVAKQEKLRLSNSSNGIDNGEDDKMNRFDSSDKESKRKHKKTTKKTKQSVSNDDEKKTIDFGSLLEKADGMIDQGEYQDAEKILIDFISEDLTNINKAKIYNKLGIVYLEQANFSDAKEAFKTALKYDKNNDLIYNNLGLALFNQGRYVEAIEAYQRSIQLNGLVPHRYINLGLSYAALRQYDKALDAYKKALVLDKNNKDYKKLVKEAEEKIAEIKNME